MGEVTALHVAGWQFKPFCRHWALWPLRNFEYDVIQGSNLAWSWSLSTLVLFLQKAEAVLISVYDRLEEAPKGKNSYKHLAKNGS